MTADVFPETPEMYPELGAHSEWVDIQFPGQAISSFVERPCFDAAGNLWVVDIFWGRVIRVAPAGAVSLENEYVGHPNGLKFVDDVRALIADGHNGLMLLDRAKGAVEPYLTRDLLEPFLGLNDLTVARNGDAYFTDVVLLGAPEPQWRALSPACRRPARMPARHRTHSQRACSE